MMALLSIVFIALSIYFTIFFSRLPFRPPPSQYAFIVIAMAIALPIIGVLPGLGLAYYIQVKTRDKPPFTGQTLVARRKPLARGGRGIHGEDDSGDEYVIGLNQARQTYFFDLDEDD